VAAARRRGRVAELAEADDRGDTGSGGQGLAQQRRIQRLPDDHFDGADGVVLTNQASRLTWTDLAPAPEPSTSAKADAEGNACRAGLRQAAAQAAGASPRDDHRSRTFHVHAGQGIPDGGQSAPHCRQHVVIAHRVATRPAKDGIWARSVARARRVRPCAAVVSRS